MTLNLTLYDTETGRFGHARREYDDMYEAEHDWSTGDWSCDCNRASLFGLEDGPCTSDRFFVVAGYIDGVRGWMPEIDVLYFNDDYDSWRLQALMHHEAFRKRLADHHEEVAFAAAIGGLGEITNADETMSAVRFEELMESAREALDIAQSRRAECAWEIGGRPVTIALEGTVLYPTHVMGRTDKFSLEPTEVWGAQIWSDLPLGEGSFEGSTYEGPALQSGRSVTVKATVYPVSALQDEPGYDGRYWYTALVRDVEVTP